MADTLGTEGAGAILFLSLHAYFRIEGKGERGLSGWVWILLLTILLFKHSPKRSICQQTDNCPTFTQTHTTYTISYRKLEHLRTPGSNRHVPPPLLVKAAAVSKLQRA